ncbi:uncharacterized protein L969DRAFT_102320 [Mixia osmundae IAM 14324]|uniref:DNA polymerase n=1 Tax=Mixia osmundae (strain CBS 9802 / IAM 14324 / JCM 22182 / KY 12970) TaxID=764103 RepID=G7EAP0_MIXOS|nr:uncharacterized protein L969DRAFT_102320 [Mixia osmundae IAM 14324]KEI40869.1 hypothetical protein L969DRAFT_102320 [Mixia osmundae IAM 14324]GAA99900.1 hypothetical protein E5Q_06603 [Mixia osmundae IAM 14324]
MAPGARAAQQSALERLKATRAGQKREFDFLQTKDAKIYDEVDEDEYRKDYKARLIQEDFIEEDSDDEGRMRDGLPPSDDAPLAPKSRKGRTRQTSGYVDMGQDEWDHSVARSDDESEDEAKASKKAKVNGTAMNGKPVKKLVNANGAAVDTAAAKASVVNPYKKEISAQKEEDFMNSLLAGIAAPAAARATTAHGPKVALNNGIKKRKATAQTMIKAEPDVFGSSDAMELDPWANEASAPPTIQSDGNDLDLTGLDAELGQDLTLDEDDEMTVKPLQARDANAPPRPAGKATKRQLVNASSAKPVPIELLKATSPAASKSAVPVSNKLKGANWQNATAGLNVVEAINQPDDDIDLLMTGATKSRAGSSLKKGQVRIPTELSSKIKAFEKDDSLHFYWLDYQEPPFPEPLRLIGKVYDHATQSYVSCCLSIHNMMRNIFALPKIPVQAISDDYEETEEELQRLTNVADELQALAVRSGVKATQFEYKFVNRKYAFEDDSVPREKTQYVKAMYPFTEPIIQETSGQFFSHLFGTRTSAFEHFALKRKLKGPCWLEIKNAELSDIAMSWCKLEVICKEPKDIRPLADVEPDLKNGSRERTRETPPLTIVSVSARTIMNHTLDVKEIVSTSLRIWKDCNIDDVTPIAKQPCSVITCVRPLTGYSFPAGFETACRNQSPKIMTVTGEHAEKWLLNQLLAALHRHDPDIIVGHEFADLLETILTRLSNLKIEHFSRLGRLRQSKRPNAKQAHISLMSGRLLCDLTNDSAKSMIASTTWSLTEMCKNQLKVEREDIDPDDTADFFDATATTPDALIRFVRHCEADAYFQMAIAFEVQVLPLTQQLTNLSGNSWGRTLSGGSRSERNEYILLHEFHRLKYIVPDKFRGRVEEVKEKYMGGKVFEPKKGLWDKYIIVMDFNSLYPSIIQEYNIDFTTVDRSKDDGAKAGADSIPDLPSSDLEQGVLPKLIATLVQRRQLVKTLMKDRDVTPARYMQYDIRQKALKLTANSMYGCLGFAGSRFYARALAALTTYKGREILTNTKELAEGIQLDVIYGDTDSVMINTNVTDLKEALLIASNFKKLINQRYRLLEIDTDAVFTRMLLLQKKKYAALKVEDMTTGATALEVKGLDQRRREFCKLAKEVSENTLRFIMSGESTEVVVEKLHEYLAAVSDEVRAGLKPLEDFIINKQLSKELDAYTEKNMPHVVVARRQKAKGYSAKAKDVVAYIFCLGEDGSSAKTAQADRARHPDDLRQKEGKEAYKVDYGYYLFGQVLPVVERLCEHIEGADRQRLAQCLGIDLAQQKAHGMTDDVEREFHTLESQISDADRFRDADPLVMRCLYCSTEAPFGGLASNGNGQISDAGLVCVNDACASVLPPASIAIQLELQVRARISQFYEGWLVCDDQECGNRTRMLAMYGKRCLQLGCRGIMHNEYTDSRLYNQLLYFDTLFDGERASRNAPLKKDAIMVLARSNAVLFAELRKTLARYMDKCGRRYVNMSNLFSFIKTF